MDLGPGLKQPHDATFGNVPGTDDQNLAALQTQTRHVDRGSLPQAHLVKGFSVAIDDDVGNLVTVTDDRGDADFDSGMAGLPGLHLLGHPHVQQPREEEITLHDDLVGTLGSQGGEGLGNRRTGHLDEGRFDPVKVVLLPEHPRQGVVGSVGIGHESTASHQHHGRVAGTPLLASLTGSEGLGETTVEGLAHPHVR